MEASCDCGFDDKAHEDHAPWCATKAGLEGPGIRLQKQPSEWSCSPTAFAMVMGIPVEEILDDLGHDDEHGFHPQELCSYALTRGWSFAMFETNPQFADGHRLSPESKLLSLKDAQEEHSMVFLGQSKNGKDHSVAWCHRRQKVMDPNHTVYDLEGNFSVDQFFIGTEIA